MMLLSLNQNFEVKYVPYPEDYHYIKYIPKDDKLIFETNRTNTFFILKIKIQSYY